MIRGMISKSTPSPCRRSPGRFPAPRLLAALLALFAAPALCLAADTHADLVALWKEWRAFEKPALQGGAPDYSAAAMARKHEKLKTWQARLAAIDPGAWPIGQQVDHHLVRAEMNGLDFNLRVLRPWVRDPAFYTSAGAPSQVCRGWPIRPSPPSAPPWSCRAWPTDRRRPP